VSLEIDVFTLFPDHLAWLPESRPVRNVLETDQLALRVLDLRDWALGDYRRVDDAPYGGGAGMLVRVDVVCSALEDTYGKAVERLRRERRVVVLTPVGRRLTDAVATEYADGPPITLLAGRYEGFDQRVHDHLASEELSIGPYVLSGGEIPAMAVVDAVARKLPGALGKAESHLHDSFAPALDGRPEYPHYTRPEEFRGWRVPEVLLSGHHARIAAWRDAQSRKRDGSDL
jgi:tRNA (guanine37-N1)-methyltransferase